jgi:hypothetical protein
LCAVVAATVVVSVVTVIAFLLAIPHQPVTTHVDFAVGRASVVARVRAALVALLALFDDAIPTLGPPVLAGGAVALAGVRALVAARIFVARPVG